MKVGKGIILWCGVATLLFCLASCRVKRPDFVLSDAKMEAVLYDYHIAKAMGEQLSYNESYKRVLYLESVFRKHGITEAGEGRVRVDFILNDPSCFKMVCRNRIREDLALFDNPASRGISILQDRLDFLYGESASFTLTREGDEMVAVLIIPF